LAIAKIRGPEGERAEGTAVDSGTLDLAELQDRAIRMRATRETLDAHVPLCPGLGQFTFPAGALRKQRDAAWSNEAVRDSK
jgi:hypothetical protein